MMDASRHEFLKIGGIAATQLLCPLGLISQSATGGGSSGGQISEAQLRQRISRLDLVYSRPVMWSEEGIPIGNGRFVGAPGFAEIVNENEIYLRAESQTPSCIFIDSAASFDAREDIASSARAQVDAILAVDSGSLRVESEQW